MSVLLPLYCTQNDVFTNSVNKDENIKGFKLPGRKDNIKLSQYADDISFISTQTFRIYLSYLNNSQYKKATGCTLNINKTERLLIETDRIFNNNGRFPIKWKTIDYVKILGIHFNNDTEMTQRYNITKCIQKMENNVKTQNQRHLLPKRKNSNNKYYTSFQALVCLYRFSATERPAPRNKQNHIYLLMEQ